MTDPVAGLREMARVTRAGGVVAACVWDHAGRRGPLRRSGARCASSIRTPTTSRGSPGAREGQLAQLFGEAGLRDVEETALAVAVEHATFDEWWEPFTLGVGPAGAYSPGSTRGRPRGSASAAARRCPTTWSSPPARGRRAAWPERAKETP